MIRFPRAKINIGLYITSKREDGYHNIESIFYPVGFNDVLEAVKASHLECHLSIQGLSIAGDSQSNLIIKAWQLMHDRHGIGGVDTWLIKNIPMGAGLGGGSSDGAHMLVLLNGLFELNLSESTLEDYASELGSDCPFFIREEPRFVMGRGDVLEDSPLSLQGYHLALIHPGIHISTKEAYSLITPRDMWTSPLPREDHSLRELHKIPIANWSAVAVNDFEMPVCKAHPSVEHAIAVLKNNGAIYTSMSGSGSAVYGLFSHPPKIEEVEGWTIHCTAL